MLGERGMWFKKHFFEKSLRIPLIMSGHGITPQRVQELTSLVDLVPTFNAISGVEEESEPLEGVDLLTLTDRGDPEPARAVYAEYLAEATPVPIFMIRRGPYKFISSSHDGELLFDLGNDPNERVNLVADADHQEVVSRFRQEVAEKWNEEELTRDILLSQKRRAIDRDAMSKGEKQRWNHGESSKDQVIWYRGEQGYNEWAFDYI
jgi:choline-sulfatase